MKDTLFRDFVLKCYKPNDTAGNQAPVLSIRSTQATIAKTARVYATYCMKHLFAQSCAIGGHATSMYVPHTLISQSLYKYLYVCLNNYRKEGILASAGALFFLGTNTGMYFLGGISCKGVSPLFHRVHIHAIKYL